MSSEKNICPKCQRKTYCKRVCKKCQGDKPRARGSVTRNLRNIERRSNDVQIVNKEKIARKKLRDKMSVGQKKSERIYRNNFKKKLDKFANKKCKCGKLLGYRNKSGFCKKHIHDDKKRERSYKNINVTIL